MNDLLDQESPTTPHFKTSFSSNETQINYQSLSRTTSTSTNASNNSNASFTTFSRASNFLKFGAGKKRASKRTSVLTDSDSLPSCSDSSYSSFPSSSDSSPLEESIEQFPNPSVKPLNITKRGSPPPPLQLHKPSLSFNENLNPITPTAPHVIPYIYKATHTLYTGKSLVGINCCFCEESLEYSLTGEKVAILQCSHVAHCECLKQLIDIPLVSPTNPTNGMPYCTTCDEVAIPVDNSLYHDLIREILLQPNKSDTLSEYSVTSPPPLTPGQQSSIATDGSPASYLGTVTTTGSTPPFISNKKLGYQELVTPTLAKPKKKKASVIKNSNTIVLKPKAPKISIQTEVDKISISDFSEQYVSCLITVDVPDDFYSSQELYRRNSEDLDNGRKITKRLANPIYERTKLDIHSFGFLRIYDTFHVSRDLSSWQETTCYLYKNMLILARDYKDYNDADKSGQKLRIKGTVDIIRHLKSVSVSSKNGTMLHLSLGSSDLPNLYLSSQNPSIIDTWRSAFLDQTLLFPIHRDISSREDFRRLSLVSSQHFTPVSSVSVRPPVYLVLILPVTGFAIQDAKFTTLRNCVNSVLSEMGRFDRLSLILYSTKVGSVVKTGFFGKDWKDWSSAIENIRPSGTSGIKNDILGALTSCNELIKSKDDEVNSVTSVFIVNDASHSYVDPIILDDTIDSLNESSANVHSFGVTINHTPDGLATISSATGGSYFYCREWSELGQCLISRFRTDQSYSHRKVEIHLVPNNQVSITSVSGVETVINSDVLQTMDGKQPSVNSKQNFKPMNLKNVELGNLFAGQTRSVLVQVAIPPKVFISTNEDWNKCQEIVKDLFTARLSYGGYGEDPSFGDEIDMDVKQTASIVLLDGPERSEALPLTPMEGRFRFSTTSSIYSPNTNSIIMNDLPPSPLYGDLLITVDMVRAPIFLSNEKHNLQVARRRIQLIAARTLENVLLQSNTGQTKEAYKSLEESRNILRGILEVALLSSEVDDLAVETKRIVEILDKDFGNISEKVLRPVVFTSDVRNWVIQTIGILRSQMGFTSRCPIEAIFYEKNPREVNEF